MSEHRYFASGADSDLVFRIRGQASDDVNNLLRVIERWNRRRFMSGVIRRVLKKRGVRGHGHDGAHVDAFDVVLLELPSQRSAQANHAVYSGGVGSADALYQWRRRST